MKKATLSTSLLLLLALAYTEYSMNSFTIISSYLFASYDSSVQGLIIESERLTKTASRSGGVGRYKIIYTYLVNENKFEGSLVNFEAPTNNVYETLKKYPVGKKITVYYDSEKPKYSVLENTGLGSRLISNLVAIILIIPIITWLVLGGRKKIDYRG